jgi:amino acid adenylation domain-containing protein
MKEEKIITVNSFKDAEEYWLDKLSGEINETRLVGDKSDTLSPRNSRVIGEIEPAAAAELLRISKNNDLSLYIILLSLFKILLKKYTGKLDITVVSPVFTAANREYNNFVPLRDPLDPDMNFKQLLMRVKETTVGAYKKEHFPMDNLTDFLDISDIRSVSSIALLLENIHQKDALDQYPLQLQVAVKKDNQRLEVEIHYNDDAFTAETIKRFIRHYSRVAAQVVEDTKREIKEVQLMTEEEKNRLIYRFNDNTGDKDRQLVTMVFKEQCRKTPHHIAVSAGLDLTDLYEALEAHQPIPTENQKLKSQLEKCRFKQDPYIFRRTLDIEGIPGGMTLLKTYRHNSILVEKNALSILDMLDGQLNVRSIHEALKTKRFGIVLYPVPHDDVLEISSRVGQREEYSYNGKLKELIAILQAYYRYRLINLTGIATQTAAEIATTQEDKVTNITGGVDAVPHLSPKKLLERSKPLSRADVLLMGGTPGMPSTGLLYLASYLKRNGISAITQFNDLNWNKESMERNIKELLDEVKPKIVAVSLKWFLHIARVQDMCRIIKNHAPGTKVVLGGNTASYYYKELIQDQNIDIIIRGDGEKPLLDICRNVENPPNTVYFQNGEIVENPLTYIQTPENSSDVYMSHLDEILLSDHAPIFGTFFIYTHKGCAMNCLYCGGCRQAQEKTFNRTKQFLRPIDTVRKDIIEAKPYTSTFMFDFDMPDQTLVEYCKKIWEGIDLSEHFCIFLNLVPPSPELIRQVTRTFKYVYWNLDIASLSERQRQELYDRRLVKPQPTDNEMMTFFQNSQQYENNEVRINTIAGLPNFTQEDIRQGQRLVEELTDRFSIVSELHWARLHAQPGAPIAEDAGAHQMNSKASTYEDFLEFSGMNYHQDKNYPDVENFVYPYIYFNDDRQNSRVSKFYSEINRHIAAYMHDRTQQTLISEEITYRQLEHRTDRLADELVKRGAGPGTIVALIASASIDVVTGILGILKSGAAYMPIDPDYPTERKQYMLKDSAAVIAVIQEERLEENKDLETAGQSLEPLVIPHTDIEPLRQQSQQTLPQTAPQNEIQPHHPAYIIYTSGTTGRPKGVQVQHKGIANYAGYRLEAYGYNDKDKTLQVLSPSFDGFCSNFYSGILSGGTLCMIPDTRKIDFNYIRETIKTKRITNVSLVPGMFRAIVQDATAEDLESLKFVILAGEKAEPELLRETKRKNPQIRFINEYGPTEATVTALTQLGMTEDTTAEVGTPITGVQVYLLDARQQPVPTAVPGEIYISGTGVSSGYLNRPEMTDEKFLPNPFVPGQRMYRTGDMARFHNNGNIRFLGRKDEQVKIRGYRIELQEIERQLSTHEKIVKAVVLTKQINEGEPFLCAYFVTTENETVDADQLRDHMFARLPDYMVPSYFLQMEKIPLTVNGKIDKKALPDPQAKMQDQYEAPGDEEEEKMAEIWAAVLGINKEKIGITNNFFELGGHSLMATVLAAKIHKEFHVNVKLVKIFENPTIKQLMQFIKGSATDTHHSIEPAPIKDYYPLSPAQRRIYFQQQSKLDATAYNNPMAVNLEGELDRGTLEQAFRQLILRHESFRTSFHMEEETPVQKIHRDVKFEIESFDEQADPETVQQQFLRPFDLAAAPLLRVGLLKTAPRHHRLMVDMHHIVSDGTSLALFIKEFITLYTGNPLPPLKLQYKDFSEWWHRRKEHIKQQGEYWKNQFKEGIPPLNIPTDFKRPPIQDFIGGTIAFQLEAEHLEALKKLALQQEVSQYILLLSIYNVFLSKLTEQTDIAVGTVLAGRRHTDLEPVVGMFINTLVLRNNPQKEKTFVGFLQDVAAHTLEAFDNQDYPIEDIHEQLATTGQVDRMFDTAFIHQNIDEPEVDVPGLKITPAAVKVGASKFDITLIARETANRLHLIFEYRTSLFNKETIERYGNYFKEVAVSILENPLKKIADLQYIPPREQQQLLLEFSGTGAGYPADRTIHDLFKDSARLNPEHTAVVYKAQRLTYEQLSRRSQRLARRLRAGGVTAGTIVALMTPRTVDAVVGMLGIIEAGGAYMPIDIENPPERIQYQLKDSNARHIVITKQVDVPQQETAPHHSEPVRYHLDEQGDSEEAGNQGESEILENINTPEDLLYVIYTSGSTGRPKGVPVCHKGFVNLVTAHRKVFGEGPGKRVSQVAGMAFDAMAFEVWPALLNGAALYIAEDEIRIDPPGMKEWLIKNKVHISFQPTVIAEQLIKEEWPAEGLELYALRTAGDKLTRTPERPLPFHFYNLYGPTEDTVWTTWTEIDADPDPAHSPFIGKPVQNHRVYILGENQELQGIGIPGELCITGDGLAKGYLNRPELTAEAFVTTPLTSPDGRLYRTGDKARWKPDGNIEFLGRIDHQVQIRGIRIEPGEIEARILEQPNVKEAAVIAVQEEHTADGRIETKLYAYVVWKENKKDNQKDNQKENPGEATTQLRENLAKKLPDYMIPTNIATLNEIPLTANGKVDRPALQKQELLSVPEEITPPETAIEKELAQIWSEILGLDIEKIGVNTNFFHAGGHSLKAAALGARIHKQMAVNIPLLTLFKAPTLRQQAEFVRNTVKNDDDAVLNDSGIQLLTTGNRSNENNGNLFLIHDGSGEVEGYSEFCRQLENRWEKPSDMLDKELNIWGIRADDPENHTPVNTTIQQIATRYLSKIIKIQPDGPYRLAGWSLGGTIVYEILRQMEQQDRQVECAILIDTAPPDTNTGPTEDGKPFSLETEKKWITRFLQDDNQKLSLNRITDWNRFWPTVIELMQKEKIDAAGIKQLLPTHMLQMIPNIEKQTISEIILQLNKIRTLTRAQLRYRPNTKIETPVHYIKAKKSKINDEKKWELYMVKPINYRTIPGDHLSIFKSPDVIELTIEFLDAVRQQ